MTWSLSDRTFSIKVDGKLSTPRTISVDVPQDFCLASTFFPIYTNDIPTYDKAIISLFKGNTVLTHNRNINYAIIQRQH